MSCEKEAKFNPFRSMCLFVDVSSEPDILGTLQLIKIFHILFSFVLIKKKIETEK